LTSGCRSGWHDTAEFDAASGNDTAEFDAASGNDTTEFDVAGGNDTAQSHDSALFSVIASKYPDQFRHRLQFLYITLVNQWPGETFDGKIQS
jgi:hypothetical protein